MKKRALHRKIQILQNGFYGSMAECSANEQLGNVHEALIIRPYADAYLAPLTAEDVSAMTVAAHEGGLRFFHRGMMSDVFPYGGEGIAKSFQHLGSAAVGGRGVGEVAVFLHILAFQTRNLAKRGIQRKGGTAVCNSILI